MAFNPSSKLLFTGLSSTATKSATIAGVTITCAAHGMIQNQPFILTYFDGLVDVSILLYAKSVTTDTLQSSQTPGGAQFIPGGITVGTLGIGICIPLASLGDEITLASDSRALLLAIEDRANTWYSGLADADKPIKLKVNRASSVSTSNVAVRNYSLVFTGTFPTFSIASE